MEEKICPWALKDPDSRKYHDERWCRLVLEDRELFALLELESFSVGLSWRLILKKEALLRAAFDSFDPVLCAQYGPEKVEKLLALPGMIHSRGKIESVIKNAKAFLAVQEECGTFLSYLRSFAKGDRIDHRLSREEDRPTVDSLSRALAKDMKKRHFSYLGPVILYSYLQAVGIVDDHLVTCPFHGKSEFEGSGRD